MKPPAWRRLTPDHAPPSVVQRFVAATAGPWYGRNLGLMRSVASRLDVPKEWVRPTIMSPEGILAMLMEEGTTYPAVGPTPVRGVPVDVGSESDVVVRLFGRKEVLNGRIELATLSPFGEWRGDILIMGLGPDSAVASFAGAVVVAAEFRPLPPLPSPLASWAGYKAKVYKTWKKRLHDLLEVYADYLGNWVLTKPDTHLGTTCVIQFPDEGTRVFVEDLLTRRRVAWKRVEGVGGFEKADDLISRCLHVPCHYSMTPADAKYVANIIARA